ncbi:MAG: hypothetical protein KatS3mg038_0446 [Candidatus Kapaibacterium sp.]|nr:MAG: hypothetical protein KatS3mg038_0446 [Candidatus Kapabacteria bacterium]
MRPPLFLPLDCAHESLIADDGLRLWPASPPQYTTIGGFGCWRLPAPLDAIRPFASHLVLAVCRPLRPSEPAQYVHCSGPSSDRTMPRSIVRETPYRMRVRAIRFIGLVIDYTDRADAARLARYYGVAVSVAAPDARVLVSHESVTIVGRDPHLELRREAAYVYEDAGPLKLSYRRDRGRIEEKLQDTGSVRCLRQKSEVSRCWRRIDYRQSIRRLR